MASEVKDILHHPCPTRTNFPKSHLFAMF